MTAADDPVTAFLEAACVPLDAAHVSGTLDRAESILAAHPDLASRDIHVAAVLGDEAAVQRFLALDAGNATAKGGPRGWDALTYLCFSRYLRLDRSRSDGFVRAARALIEAGASASTGWTDGTHQPHPEWESVLYGAAGIAHHAELTRLLLECGADPNDEETPYHAPETYDNDAMKVLVESGRLTGESLATMLLRKADWHDHDGLKWLLEHGADPNRMTRWGKTAFHQAVLRDNSLQTIHTLVDHGANPALSANGASVTAIAARRGRGDILEVFARRGIPIDLDGVDRLLAACARNDEDALRTLVGREPHLVEALVAHGGTHLAEFAGNGNSDGVRHLLDLGVAVDSVHEHGDGYFGVAKNSTALHVAAWRAWPPTVKLLIERGAPIEARDGHGRTALALAVRACVDSYWTYRRSPESVEALLRAGASVSGVGYPSGYGDVDELLARHQPRT